MRIDIDKYFERIGYKGSRTVSVKTLKAIHAAQVFSIPFENIAIHELQNVNNDKNFIKLDEASLFKKLVTDKRGGYCHENNELLALVLIQLGFKVDRLAARVLTAPNLPRGHKLLMVTINDEKWIADVGFGGYGLFRPMLLETNKKVRQYCDYFQFAKVNDKYIYQIVNGDACKNLYEFTLEVFEPVDFVQMSYNVSHNPESIFVTNRLCVMPTPEGRIILNNNKLKITKNGEETTFTIKSDNEYLDILQKHFGIELPQGTKLKEMKDEKKLTNVNRWCNYFAKATLVVGIPSALYLCNEYVNNVNNQY